MDIAKQNKCIVVVGVEVAFDVVTHGSIWRVLLLNRIADREKVRA